MLILIVGMPSSGKTTAAQIFEEMGFSVASTGDIVREEIKSRDLSYTKENDREVADWFHEEGRETLVIERLLSKLKGKNKVIEGLRDPKQMERLENKTGKRPVIIAIESSFESRLKRELAKKRFPDMTREDLEKRDQAELRLGEGELIGKADYTIDNTNLTKEELKEELKKILEDINI
ncbi:MAG: AAA family ATPase [Candidatus Aenigmarchaeota archaeon]|nr:AAA family ATPase [Candidatus Aenigmarchaeota archaeon]